MTAVLCNIFNLERNMDKSIRCCPFCGSHEVEVCRTNPNSCWIRCAVCGCDAESDKTRVGAIANWNRRHFDEDAVAIVDDNDKDYHEGA